MAYGRVWNAPIYARQVRKEGGEGTCKEWRNLDRENGRLTNIITGIFVLPLAKMEANRHQSGQEAELGPFWLFQLTEQPHCDRRTKYSRWRSHGGRFATTSSLAKAQGWQIDNHQLQRPLPRTGPENRSSAEGILGAGVRNGAQGKEKEKLYYCTIKHYHYTTSTPTPTPNSHTQFAPPICTLTPNSYSHASLTHLCKLSVRIGRRGRCWNFRPRRVKYLGYTL